MLTSADAVALDAIAECLVAVERESATPRAVTTVDVERRLHFNGSDPRLDAMAFLVAGQVAAFVHLWRHDENELRVFARTRPAMRGRGAGTASLAWALQRAQAIGPACAVSATSQSKDEAAARLLKRTGFSPVRHIITMTIAAGDVASEQPSPHGVRIRAYEPDDEDQLLAAHASAFADEWGYVSPASRASWWAERDDVDPALSLVAVVRDEVVGFCLSGPNRISEIGVVATHRRRGIGAALLGAGLHLLARAGAAAISLQVDGLNGSGAQEMYSRAGMRTIACLTAWRLERSSSHSSIAG